VAGQRHVTIAGAGIGGLTAALCLARAGFAVTVLERAPALEEVGAGIQLSPNASRVLIALGLADALAPTVVAPAGMDVRSGPSGALLAAAGLGAEAARRWGAPWWVVHRADLLAVLAQAAAREPAINVDTGTAVEGLVPAAGGFDLALSGGGRRHVAALVGADGIRSVVRLSLGDAAPPVFRRRSAFRATLDMAAVPPTLRGDRLGLWLGPDAHLVHYPLRAGSLCNVVVIIGDEAPIEGWRAPGDPAVVAARLSGWSEAPRRLVAAAGPWQRWSLADRPTWFGPGKGAATLLGDAAHAMLPFVAQGGAMAIEDAAVLARCCAAAPDDLPRAFRAYEGQRAARVVRIQSLARRNGAIYHLKGPAAFARDAAIRLMGGRGLLAQQDWIYAHRL
jgi:salicylate hydroxylase